MNENFYKCLNTYETYYLITYTNLNNNIVREICITDDDFIKAIEIENNISFRDSLKTNDPFEYYFSAEKFIKKNGSRHFKFNKAESLELLDQCFISEEEMNDFEKRTNIKLLLENIKNKKNWFLETTTENYKDEKIYAFLLSKAGYIIGYTHQCFGLIGLICSNCNEN